MGILPALFKTDCSAPSNYTTNYTGMTQIVGMEQLYLSSHILYFQTAFHACTADILAKILKGKVF